MAVVIWVIAAAALLRGGVTMQSLLILGGVTVLLAAGFFALRPVAAPRQAAAEIKSRIGAGKPVLLEFRSQN
jgi:hypothetical protein